MPRKARIDAPDALHHIIVRGIERRAIVRDDTDRDRFCERLGKLLSESHTPCYAWALLSNHFHLLLRTGMVPIASFMGRLLTGYAVSFNKRHKRHGHLFQNRYTSILCEEDPYFLELVRYIHLNPLRARIAATMESLDVYPYAGHSTLIGHGDRGWQDTEYVLGFFGPIEKEARKRYRSFVEEGIPLGRRRDLTGGGVMRSNQGWRPAKGESVQPKGDERILGQSSFVMRALRSANETWERRYALRMEGFYFDRLCGYVSHLFALPVEVIVSPDKRRDHVQARSVLCFWAIRELGMTATALAGILGVSQPAVSNAVNRGSRIVKERGLALPVRGDEL